MITAADILTDADVAKLAGVSVETFQRSLRYGIPPGEIDWLAAKPMLHGGRRRWLRQDVERVIRDRVTKGW